MAEGVGLGFFMEPLSVALVNLLPSRNIPKELDGSRKFKQILSSIKEIGLIEPLSITPIIKKSEHHMLLDGHVRLVALRDLGYEEAPCLVANDDEGYTYNSRINRLSTIQENEMDASHLMQANGAGEELPTAPPALALDSVRRAVPWITLLVSGSEVG